MGLVVIIYITSVLVRSQTNRGTVTRVHHLLQPLASQGRGRQHVGQTEGEGHRYTPGGWPVEWSEKNEIKSLFISTLAECLFHEQGNCLAIVCEFGHLCIWKCLRGELCSYFPLTECLFYEQEFQMWFITCAYKYLSTLCISVYICVVLWYKRGST